MAAQDILEMKLRNYHTNEIKELSQHKNKVRSANLTEQHNKMISKQKNTIGCL